MRRVRPTIAAYTRVSTDVHETLIRLSDYIGLPISRVVELIILDALGVVTPLTGALEEAVKMLGRDSDG